MHKFSNVVSIVHKYSNYTLFTHFKMQDHVQLDTIWIVLRNVTAIQAEIDNIVRIDVAKLIEHTAHICLAEAL